MRRWNDDPFTKKARRENYEARSVYKLEEIDRREKILKGAQRILDLGASPGSWTQYCLKVAPQAKILAVDLAPLRVADPRVTFLEQSIESVDFAGWLNGSKADVVLSDMAPKTSGLHDRDVALSLELAGLALQVAEEHLSPKGTFVVKLFMGAEFETFHARLKNAFQSVRLLRPESTRKHSREIFFIARGLKQAAPGETVRADVP